MARRGPATWAARTLDDFCRAGILGDASGSRAPRVRRDAARGGEVGRGVYREPAPKDRTPSAILALSPWLLRKIAKRPPPQCLWDSLAACSGHGGSRRSRCPLWPALRNSEQASYMVPRTDAMRGTHSAHLVPATHQDCRGEPAMQV